MLNTLQALFIDYANIMKQASGANGNAASVEQIYFYDEGGTDSITIGAGSIIGNCICLIYRIFLIFVRLKHNYQVYMKLSL